jgi:hypothetical protein
MQVGIRYDDRFQRIETWFDRQDIRFQQSFIAWDTPDLEVFHNVDRFYDYGFFLGGGVGYLLRGKMMQKRIETGLHSDLSDSAAKAADEMRRR